MCGTEPATQTASTLQMAEDLYWHRLWMPDHHRYNFDMGKGPISSEWFRGAKTNMCVAA